MSQPPRLPFGIAYSPENVDNSSYRLSITELSKQSDLRYVRVQWVDLSGQIRYKVLPKAYFLRIVTKSDRPGITLTAAVLSIIAGGCSPGFSGIGEWLYAFDLDTLRRVVYEPGHAVVVGYFQEEEPHPVHGVDIPLCPRSVLKKVVKDAETAGVRFLAGVEHEFVLLSKTSPATAINTADWTASNKLASGSLESKVLQEIADVLQASNIELQMYHAEASPGQYEVITGPLPPLEAADTVIYTRETIYNVASKYGLRATFVPRVRPGAFTAAHTHVSVYDIDSCKQTLGEQKPFKNPSFGETLTATERSFLQGILTHLPSILPFTYPTQYSYDRVQDGMWTGGSTVCWGTNHREAPIRLTGAPGGHHFEVRCVDGTASPYLALAALFAAGLEGIKQKAALTYGDCKKAVPEMSPTERKEVGLDIQVKLPTSLHDARVAMQQSPFVQGVFGEEFITKFSSVNQTLEKHLTLEDQEERITRFVSIF